MTGVQPAAGACSGTNQAMRRHGTPDPTGVPLWNGHYRDAALVKTRRRDLVQAVDPETEGSAGNAEDRQPRKLRQFVHRGLPESGETGARQATHVKARENAIEFRAIELSGIVPLTAGIWR